MTSSSRRRRRRWRNTSGAPTTPRAPSQSDISACTSAVRFRALCRRRSPSGCECGADVAAPPRVIEPLPIAVSDFDLHLPSGRIRAHRFGDPAGELILCAPGLSANSRWFDYLAERLADSGRRIVALDLRGRGHSALTALGTYGYKNHALDLFAAAEALGATRFDLIGHSMGAYVGMEAAALDSSARLRRLVLIDGLGIPRYAAIKSILRNLHRLDCVHPSAEQYLASIRSLKLIDPWNEYWDRLYRYELV